MSDKSSQVDGKAQGQICTVCGAIYYGSICSGCNPSLPFDGATVDVPHPNGAVGTPSQLELVAR